VPVLVIQTAPRARRSGSCRSRERADRFAQNSLP